MERDGRGEGKTNSHYSIQSCEYFSLAFCWSVFMKCCDENFSFSPFSFLLKVRFFLTNIQSEEFHINKVKSINFRFKNMLGALL